MKKIHWPAIGAAAVSVLGVASSPAVLGLLPPQWAAAVAGAGIIAQAFTKPVPKADAVP
jgi:hypothetical protein